MTDVHLTANSVQLQFGSVPAGLLSPVKPIWARWPIYRDIHSVETDQASALHGLIQDGRHKGFIFKFNGKEYISNHGKDQVSSQEMQSWFRPLLHHGPLQVRCVPPEHVWPLFCSIRGMSTNTGLRSHYWILERCLAFSLISLGAMFKLDFTSCL